MSVEEDREPKSSAHSRAVARAAAVVLTASALAVAGCGGNDGGSPQPVYSVGGYVAGLNGSGLALSYNGGPPISISRDGAFTAATGVAGGSPYSLTLAGQPTNPTQLCVLSNDSGTVETGDVTSVRVFCPQAVGRWAYVVTQGSAGPVYPPVPGTISIFTIDPSSGALTPVPGSAVSTGALVTSFQRIPHSSFAWALSVENPDNVGFTGGIYDYGVDSNTGLLNPVAGSPFLTLRGTNSTPAGCPGGPSGTGDTAAVTLHPSGMFGYAANPGNSGLENLGTWTFMVDSTTGAPSQLGSSVSGACGAPVTVDPSGQFAYVPSPSASANSTVISAYTIDAATGALTPVPGASPTIPVNDKAVPVNNLVVTVDPFGRFLYVLYAGNLWAFAIDSSGGALTPVSGSPFALPSIGTSMAIEPRGQFAYVIVSDITGAQDVYTYTIDTATGAITPVGSPVALVAGPRSPLQIDPGGQFAYVTGDTAASAYGIYAYAIDANTGALTLVPGSPFAAASSVPAVMEIAD